jgi:hypothetical protein
MDRVQNSMPGALLTLGAATCRDIFDNILPDLFEYLIENCERGIYFEVGREPPRHFKPCATRTFNWNHTISFVSGTVIKFVSADRLESVLGLNAAHSFRDELLKIKKEFMLEGAMPILRSDRARFGLSPYFMGWSGFTSTPNFETDEDWFLELEKDMNVDLVNCIQEIAWELDMRLQELELARKSMDTDKVLRLERFVERWDERLSRLRSGQTCYVRASSFSNLKILGIDYIQNQIKSIKDKDMLYTSIYAIRKLRVRDMFFGKFGRQHLFDDGYDYRYIDCLAADGQIEDSSRHLRYYDKKLPLYAGYDAGPFSSIVFAQRHRKQKEFRILKNMWAIHPEQQDVLARKIDGFFSEGRKEIFLHYDWAANQKEPEWKKYYPSYKEEGINDTQLSSALMYLLWGEYSGLLPASDQNTPAFYGEGEKQRRVRVPVEHPAIADWLDSWESQGFEPFWEYLRNLITDYYYVNTVVTKYHFTRARRLGGGAGMRPVAALGYVGADEARLATRDCDARPVPCMAGAFRLAY